MNIEIKESMVQYFIQTRVGGGAEIKKKHIYYVDKIAMKNYENSNKWSVLHFMEVGIKIQRKHIYFGDKIAMKIF
jgi:hypothetical protein